jgi:hypothetical protein
MVLTLVNGAYETTCRHAMKFVNNDPQEMMMADSTLQGRVLWYELMTTDMHAAEKFYRRWWADDGAFR